VGAGDGQDHKIAKREMYLPEERHSYLVSFFVPSDSSLGSGSGHLGTKTVLRPADRIDRDPEV